MYAAWHWLVRRLYRTMYVSAFTVESVWCMVSDACDGISMSSVSHGIECARVSTFLHAASRLHSFWYSEWMWILHCQLWRKHLCTIVGFIRVWYTLLIKRMKDHGHYFVDKCVTGCMWHQRQSRIYKRWINHRWASIKRAMRAAIDRATCT